MIHHNPSSTPHSNRGGQTRSQKTNLQINVQSVSIDRLRICTHLPGKIDPRELISTIYGLDHSDTRNTRWGKQKVTLYRGWSGPLGSPGRIYHHVEAPSDAVHASKRLVIEFNPNHGIGLKVIPEWLSYFGYGDWFDCHVDRLDIAFDFPISRDYFSIEAAPKRKGKIHTACGSNVETHKYSHSDTKPGVLLYDKALEQFERTDTDSPGPLTRCEYRIHPYKHLDLYENKDRELGPVQPKSFRIRDIEHFQFPDSKQLGSKLIYMPIPSERFSRTDHSTRYYALCRELAEYDVLRARKRIIDYALDQTNASGRRTTRDTAADVADALLETVDLGTIWTDYRGTAWRQISPQPHIPGTRPVVAQTPEQT